MNGATCLDGINSFSCECIMGYIGERCETNFDDCKPNPCKHGGHCRSVFTQYARVFMVRGYGSTISINIS